MPNFAVIDGIDVLNIIVADSKELAENFTGKTCVEFGPEDSAEIGGTYSNGKFLLRKPYPSWILGQYDTWESPAPYPAVDINNPVSYVWNEETTSWVLP